MVYGEIYTCEISPVTDVDLFDFYGTAGETVLLTLTDTSGYDGTPVAQVYDPNGQPVVTLEYGGERTWQNPLPETGTYTVVVTDVGNDQTTNYHLGLQRIFPALASALTLCVDCVLQELISPVADSDVILFDGSAGETVLLTLTDTSGYDGTPVAQVYDPSGEPVATLEYGGERTWQNPLPETGTYTVVVTDVGNDQTTNYHLGLQRIFPAPASAFFLCSGCVLLEAITPVADSDIVLFDGADGCTVTLTLTDTSGYDGTPVAEVYDPNGQPVFSLDGNGTPWQGILTETGIYTVVVTDVGNDQTTNYHLGLQHLFGTCAAPRPEITAITSPDPLRLVFPETVVGQQSAVQTVTVRNDGGDTLDVGGILLFGDNADEFTIGTDGCSGQALAPTASCTLDVTFDPLSLGAKSAYLEIPSNDADEDPVYVVLATDHDEPEIAVAPDLVDFGTVPVSGSATQTVWIDNYGSAPLQLGALSITGTNANQFALSADNCSDRRLFSFQSCSLTVEFGPTSVGNKTAILEILSDDPDEGTIEVTLLGNPSDELAADFGTNGLWHYHGVWSRLSSWDPGTAGLAGWSQGLAVDFDANGLWTHDGSSWHKLTGWNAGEAIAGWSGGLAADFDANGLWSHDGTSWHKLTAWNAEALASWSNGLAVDFGTKGLWTYDGSSWRKLTGWNPGDGGLAGWSEGFAVDFDANGTWSYDGSNWHKMTGWNPGSGGLAGWSEGLAVDFDANGTWGYDGTNWRRLSTWNPGSGGLAGWSTDLAVDFDANGLWNNDGTSWGKLTGWSAQALEAVDLNP